MKTLSTYLTEHGLTGRAFAAQIEVDPSIVSRLCRKEMRPSLKLAGTIERVTGGAVPMASWLDSPESGLV